MMMHNQVAGVVWNQLYTIIKYLKNRFSLWSWTGAFLLSIVDVNIVYCRKKLVCLLKFYVTLIK